MIFSIENTISLAAFFITLISLVLLLPRRPKTKKLNLLTALLVIMILWQLVEYFAHFIFFDETINLYLWRGAFLIVMWVLLVLSFLVVKITENTVSSTLRFVISAIYSVFSLLTLFTRLVIQDVYISSKGTIDFNGGSLFTVIAFSIFIPLVFSLALTVKTYLKTKNHKIKRSQLGYVILGLFLPVVVGITTNVILPALGFEFPRIATFSGAILVVIFVYGVFRWNMFDTRLSNYSIRSKIMVPMILLSVVAALVVAIFLNKLVEGVIRTQIESEMKSSISSRGEIVEVWIDEKVNDVRFILADIEINPGNSFEKSDKLESYLDSIIEDDDELLDAQVIYLSQDKADFEHSDTSITEMYDEILEQGYFIGDPYRYKYFDVNVVEIGYPLFDSEGEYSAFVLFHFNLEDILGAIAVGDFEDKDVHYYIVNSDRDIISKRLSEEYSEKSINTKSVEQCFIDGKNDYQKYSTILYTDFRGEEVLGTYRYLERTGWCIIGEIDEEKAFASVSELTVNILLSWGLYAVVMIGVIYWVSDNISTPLRKFQEDVEIVESGLYNHNIDIHTNDEIGSLARSFEKLTKTLRKSKRSVEKRVKLQTEQIEKSEKRLRNQKEALQNLLDDVTDQKDMLERATNDLKKFQLAVQNASDHIVITDPDGIILFANRAVEKITGYSSDNILGEKAGTSENWGGLMKKSFYKKLWKTVKKEKKVFQGEIQNKRKDGSKYYAYASIAPVVNDFGDVEFFVAIERDITQEKLVDKAKTEFVSLASHQLRTPLSAINWYAEMLMSGDAGELNEDQKEFLMEIYKGNQRMVDLVNALLNVSRIEVGTFYVDPEPTDIVELAKQVLKELEPEIEKKNHDIETEFDDIPKIKVDPKLTGIIFQNVLSNAVKYTPPGGKVKLDVKEMKKGGTLGGRTISEDSVCICVSDNGMGIPKKQQDQVFDKLFRADNVRSADTEGTGLGLYIVKSIVEHSDGEIWFESEVREGTTFYVILPKKGMKRKKGSKKLN